MITCFKEGNEYIAIINKYPSLSWIASTEEGAIKGLRILIQEVEGDIRKQIAQEIEDSFDPPPIDEKDYLIWEVIERCANIARGAK